MCRVQVALLANDAVRFPTSKCKVGYIHTSVLCVSPYVSTVRSLSYIYIYLHMYIVSWLCPLSLISLSVTYPFWPPTPTKSSMYVLAGDLYMSTTLSPPPVCSGGKATAGGGDGNVQTSLQPPGGWRPVAGRVVRERERGGRERGGDERDRERREEGESRGREERDCFFFVCVCM